MGSVRFVALFVSVVCLLGGVAAAAPDTPASGAAPALQQKEETARKKAADEMAGLAKFCAMYSAYDEARQAWTRAIALSPPAGADALKAELEKIKDKAGTPAAGAVAQVSDRRTKALAKCADVLAPAAAAYAFADRQDDLLRVVALMRAQGLPAAAPLAKLDVVFFDPYLEWHKKKDAEKLDAGWEVVDGAWVDPAKVAELNAAHATWKSPWVVSDDVHEVRTTLPLRTAKQTLAWVGSFRRFFLEYFAGDWDLKAPPAKLQLFLAATRAELDARWQEWWPGATAAPPEFPSFYLPSTRVGNPCFVSLEVMGPGGAKLRLDTPTLRRCLRYEVAKQVAHEFSKHGADGSRLSHGQTWALEGLPELMTYFDLVDGAWVLTRPKQLVMFGTEVESAFAYCRANAARIPPLGKFVGLTRETFPTAANFKIAPTFAWFLLEGKERAYRKQFVKVLETVHQCRDEPDTFIKCFAGVHDLDADFRTFCKAIQIDK